MKKKLVGALCISCLGGWMVQAEQTFADENSLTSNGSVQFIPNTDPVDPVNPVNPDPDNPVRPIDPTKPDGPDNGTDGPLSLDYVSSFDFGLNQISTKDQVYYARAQKYQGAVADTPNYVQVSDNRGTNAGWRLTVAQTSPLKATTETLNNVLRGAQISLQQPSTKSNGGSTAPVAKELVTLMDDGTAEMVVTAAQNTGAGTWATSWGTVEKAQQINAQNEKETVTITKAVALAVPGKTPKDAVTYQTTLNWTLSDAPTND